MSVPLALTLALGGTGCAGLNHSIKSTINNDLAARGGAASGPADRVMPVTNKRGELFRAVVVFDLITRAASSSLSGQQEIVAFNEYMHSVDDDISVLHNHENSENCDEALSTVSNSALDCKQYFESDLPQLEGGIFKLAALSLPQAQFETIEKDIVTGSYLKGALALAKVAGVMLSVAHADAATIRSLEEVMELPAKGETSPEPFTSAAKPFLSGAIPDWAFRSVYGEIRASCHDLKDRLNSGTPGASNVTCDFAWDSQLSSGPSKRLAIDSSSAGAPAASATH
ncbi:MAG: hypothetical protein ACRED9_00010 [Caulobacteraceae bacterium]